MPGDTAGIWGYKFLAYSPDPDGSEIGGICTHLDKRKSMKTDYRDHLHMRSRGFLPTVPDRS